MSNETRRSTKASFLARPLQPIGPLVAALVAATGLAGCGRKQPPPAPVPGPAPTAAAEMPRASPPPAPPRPLHADFDKAHPTVDVRRMADWAVASADPKGRPYIVVDKVNARVWAFDADGHLRGNAPALLGLARGDDSVPGIGERPIKDIKPEERTTPAGRFEAEMGRNAQGEDILWVDYDDAVSMHRVRPLVKSERRLERLASPTPKDNRISYGCINLPVAFYDQVVRPLFAARNGVVYVLPETRSLQAQFGPQFATLVAGGN